VILAEIRQSAPVLGYMCGHPGKKLLFMGGEIGQWDEWNFEKSLDWNLLDYEAHRGRQKICRGPQPIAERKSALYELDFEHQGFEWIDINDTDNSTISFLRKGRTPLIRSYSSTTSRLWCVKNTFWVCVPRLL